MRTFMSFALLLCGGCLLYRIWKKFKREASTRTTIQTDVVLPAVSDDNKKGKEELRHSLDMVNSWIGNCDQKASIVLSIVGVALTILMASDFVVQLRRVIFKPFFDYWGGNTDLGFDFSRFTMFLFFVVTIALLGKSSHMMVKAITPNINYAKMYADNPKLVPKSYIFYGTIAAMNYDSFVQENVKYEDDLKSQIYVNSKIALAKFENFREGLYWFKITFLFSILLFLSIMFL